MPAPLRIILTPEEDTTLRELRLAKTVPQRTRDRAHILRLNAQGWNTPAIAEMFECHQHTVRKTIRRWEEGGLGGLWEAAGRGAKPKCKIEDMQYVTELLAKETRTYNSSQLVKKLKQERGVDLSSDRLRRLLKKNNIDPIAAILKSIQLQQSSSTYFEPLQAQINVY
jgi:transposase